MRTARQRACSSGGEGIVRHFLAERRQGWKVGFTLIEVMLALAILVMIAGVVFSLARQTMGLSRSVVEKQREAIHRQSFFEFMSSQLAKLPGNAIIDVTFEDPPGNGPYLSSLVVQNAPTMFGWGGTNFSVEAVELQTVMRRDGLLDVVLNYYNVEILEQNSETAVNQDNVFDPGAEPILSIVMLEGVRWFEWQILDSRDGEWYNEWHNPGRQPVLMQLDVAFGAGAENLRQIFWLPPKQNPVAFMRQLGMGAGAGPGGAPGAGGEPGAGPGGGQGGQNGEGSANSGALPPGIQTPSSP